MKRSVLLFLVLLFGHQMQCQEREKIAPEASLFSERMAEFPGGNEALHAYLKKNSVFPIAAVTDKEKGEHKVIVSFVVAVSGKLAEVTVLRSTSDAFSSEAIRLVNNMPLWKPASNNGKPIAMKIILPIVFK